jgi:hypothetical protein
MSRRRQGLRLETQTFDEHVRVSASTEGSAVKGAQLSKLARRAGLDTKTPSQAELSRRALELKMSSHTVESFRPKALGI